MLRKIGEPIPERLIGLSAGQIAILRRLAAGEMPLAEMELDDTVHLAIQQNRGLSEADKDEEGRVVVRLTADGRRLMENRVDQ